MPAHSIIIAAPDPVQSSRLNRIVGAQPQFRVIASTGDLMNTYYEVEHRKPRAVLIADVLAALPEFEVMHALFSTLDIRWLVIKSSLDGKRFEGGGSEQPPHSGADLFSVAADAPEESIVRQLLSLTRTCTSRMPAAKPRAANGQRPPLTNDQPPGARPIGLRSRPLATIPPSPDNKTHRRRTTGSYGGIGAAAHERSLILIGASTGGVDALLEVLSNFTPDCPPTLIVQHTGAGFGESLVSLLDRQCKAKVSLAAESMSMQPGHIIVGAGTRKHLVIEDCNQGTCGLVAGDPVSGHIPSVDMLFQSAVPIAPRVTAALLTGMGRDGAEGLRALHGAGARTYAQNEQTSVVYGMPRAAVELGAAKNILALDEIGPALLQSAAATIHRGRELLK